MKPDLLVRSALIAIYVFYFVEPFPEPYLGRKSRMVRYVKTDPTEISVIHCALCAKFGLITSI